MRIVVGSTVYDPSQNTITIPTSPLTSITNTKLLLNATTAATMLTDASGIQTLTNNNSVSWSGGTPYQIDITGTPTISNSVAGGVWSSSNTSIITVNASGGLTPVASGTATVTYTVSSSSPIYCTSSDVTTVVITAANGTWTGAVSTDWSLAGNWSNGSLPNSGDAVTIPSGLTNNPVLTSNTTIGSLALNGTLGLGGKTLTLTNTVTGSGVFKTGNTSSLMINGIIGTLNFDASDNTLQNLTIASGSVTLGSKLNIIGTVTSTSGTLTTGGYLTLLSNASGTARINQVLGTITGNVTVQRYIPSKIARRYCYLGSTVSQSVRSAWQQQIYISGTGTGGQVCGTTTGNGGSTDKYNSNGFDVTQNNTASMMTYNASPTNNSHYVTIPNTTSTSLMPGIGYILNIRGDRNSSNVACVNQLSSATPIAPEAVTLSATGTITTGDLSVALNDPSVHLFTLLANPYPSQISFTNFKTSNSTAIYGKMWTYGPLSSGFTTYLNGHISNAISGYDDTNGDYIASGQAFFVQAKTSGNVTFQENHKTTGTIPNTSYFGVNSDKSIRIRFVNAANDRQDEIVLVYNKNGSKQYNPEIDAVNLNSKNLSLVSIKQDTNRLAITTHPDVMQADTTQLGIGNKVGSYSLQFSEMETLDKTQTVTLLDKFLNTVTDVRNNAIYNFNITADTATKGDNRFQVIVGGAAPLPVNFIDIAASRNNGIVVIKWVVASQEAIASYSVEKSTNGVTFNTVATQKAATINSYKIEDSKLPSGDGCLYYRIKSISNDGKVAYSKVMIPIDCCSIHSPEFTIYPNPVKDKFNLNVSSNSTRNYKLYIATVQGKQIFSGSATATPNNLQSTINVKKLSSGIYLLKLIDDKGVVYTEQFVKE